MGNSPINMKNLYLFTALLLLFSACDSEDPEKEGVIPPVEMADIISDIYLAEYKSSHLGLNQDSLEVLFRHYELQTYDDHGVSDSIYKKSFAYYIDHPRQLEKIYDMVIDSLSLNQQIRNKKQKKQQQEARNRTSSTDKKEESSK